MTRLRRVLRGPFSNKLLARLGIDSKRFWLLVDLFGELSERSEILDQLGRNGVALKSAAWMYFVFSALMSLLAMVAQPPLRGFSAAVLGMSTLLLLCVLLMETGNSLVNPVEAAVLAHHPISGATYTAAKLTHLITIVLYFVAGLNTVPAFAGLALKGAPWFYPLAHFGAALLLGFAIALCCCALFGWLIRFVPVARLKATTQLIAVMPFLLFSWPRVAGRWFTRLHVGAYLPGTAARFALATAAAAAAAMLVVMGLRALSADYLIRVSAMTRGGPGGRARRSRLGGVVARWFGGQGARAGFAFTSRMMRRDWQFKRQVLPMALPALLSVGPLVVMNWRKDPFAGSFTPVHLVPHAIGVANFIVCFVLPYGNDYKGAWLFLLAPPEAMERFACGVHALLWMSTVVVPHLILLPVLAWGWGVWHAGLFTAYSAAVASLYLALELRLVEGAPFSSAPDAARGATMLPILILGGIAMAIVAGVQYLVLFQSPALAAAAAAMAGAGAWWATRASLAAFAASIRYHLALISAESGTLYKEVL